MTAQKLRSGWSAVRLGDVCREITVGHVGPMADRYVASGVPFLRSQNIVPFRLNLADIKFIPEDFHKKLKKSALATGDVAIVRTGYPGTACVIPPSLGRANCSDLVIARPGDMLDPWYLAALLNSSWGRGMVAGNVVGAAQQHFNVGAAKLMQVFLPPIATQRRIASILSAYDDLIENNTRRIAILEEMARRIYEEWFVRFRFPGHERVRMVESESRLVPEGWSVVRLDDVLVLQRGFDLPKQARSDGPFPIISATGKSGTHHEFRVKGPGVVTGRSGSLGAVMYVEDDFWPLNTTLWVKKFSAGSALYAYYVLQSIDLAGFNSGAAVPTLNRNDIHGLPALRPAPDVLAAFDEVIGPILRLKRRLELAIENLRTTRDLLLPRLISGELDVSTLPETEVATA